MTAERERMAPENAYCNALDRVTPDANDILENGSQFQPDKAELLPHQRNDLVNHVREAMPAQEAASHVEILAITDAGEQQVANLNGLC